MIIMALNCGSSSVKYQLFDWENKMIVAKGMVERVIIGDSFIMHEVPGRETHHHEHDCPNHQAAIDLLIKTVTDPVHGVIKSVDEISAVGHRVVHGGEDFQTSVLITPEVLTELEETMEEAGLRHDSITIRMTGCPNGCGRPFISEIGFVGRGPDRYNLYLGGGHAGQRLSKLYRQDLAASEIRDTLSPIVHHYAKERNEGEHFGDFVIRSGYVAATAQGNDFHQNIKPEAVQE